MSKKQSMDNKHLELLIDSFPGAMIILDINGKILGINKTLAQIFSKPRDKIIGETAFSYLEKNVAKTRLKILQDVIIKKQPITFIDFERKRWWKTTAIPLLDEAGNVTNVAGFIEDITDEKVNEQKKLINQEEYYISLIENSMDLITVIDKTGKILYESPSLNQILGYNVSDRLGKKVFENIHPDCIDDVKKYFKEIGSKPGLTDKLTFKIKDKNGIYHYFESIGNNQFDNRIIKGLIVNSRDVTERHKDKEKISKQKQFLDSIVNSACEIIFTVDRDHKMSLWNDAAELNTGFPKAKILGKKTINLDLFENISELHEYLNNSFAGKNGFLNELIVKSDVNGKRIWVVSPSKVKSNDVITDVMFICQDITFKDEIHGQLIPGSAYIVSEVSVDSLFDIFEGLLNEKWMGLLITRKLSDLSSDCFKKFQPTMLMFSSYDSVDKGVVSNLEELFDAIEVFVKEEKNAAICLNRADYLISRFGFNRVLDFLYRVNDLIRGKQALFLLRVNKTLFSSVQICFLKEEFLTFPLQQIDNMHIEDMLYDILDFIFKENEKNLLVSQRNICSHVGISKVTAQKRIINLLDKELIFSRKSGRSKFLHVTDKGKKLLHQRKIK